MNIKRNKSGSGRGRTLVVVVVWSSLEHASTIIPNQSDAEGTLLLLLLLLLLLTRDPKYHLNKKSGQRIERDFYGSPRKH